MHRGNKNYSEKNTCALRLMHYNSPHRQLIKVAFRITEREAPNVVLKPGTTASLGDDKFGVPNPNLLLYAPAFRPPVWPGFFLPEINSHSFPCYQINNPCD